MKNLIISSLLVLTVASCGKNNKVSIPKDTTTPVPTSTTTTLETTPVSITTSDFVGTFDLLRAQSGDCSPTIQIKRECDGLTLKNSDYLRAEDFCNINSNERDVRNNNRNEDNSGAVVTLVGNEVKSVVTLSKKNRFDPRRSDEQVVYTNSLIINKDGTLTKNFSLKSRSGSCVYKRILYSPTSQVSPL